MERVALLEEEEERRWERGAGRGRFWMREPGDVMLVCNGHRDRVWRRDWSFGGNGSEREET